MCNTTPEFDPSVGVRVTRPATFRKACRFADVGVLSPTVAAGTFTVTTTWTVLPGLTRTEAGLNVTVFGALPGVLAELRSNRAVDVPLFVIHSVAPWEKSWPSSVKPRFRLTAPGSK